MKYSCILLVLVSMATQARAFVPSSSSFGTRTSTTARSAYAFDDLRKSFPENPNIVAAGGWNTLEKTLSEGGNNPKQALVDLVVDGLKGTTDGAVQPKQGKDAALRLNEKIEALSLLLYGMGKGFSADTIDGEWDLVFTKQGKKSPSFQKIVGTRETAGRSKNFFDIRSMIFTGDVRFWRWGKVSSTVKVRKIFSMLEGQTI